jgi:hypothetical protein
VRRGIAKLSDAGTNGPHTWTSGGPLDLNVGGFPDTFGENDDDYDEVFDSEPGTLIHVEKASDHGIC